MKSRNRPAGPPRRAARSRPRGARWRHPALWTAAAAFALYLPSLGGGFVWDDRRLIAENPLMHTPAGLARLLSGDFWMTTGHDASGFWRPLVVASFALDGVLSHWHPWLFRLMNALGHAGASALVTVLALGSGAPWIAALAGGLWFAAMPLHVESVAWISGRTDVYCALFLLLALVLDRRARRAGRGWPGWGALTALGAALLAKEAAAPFLGVVAIAEWVEPGRRFSWRASVRWLAPYAAVTAVYLAAHAALTGVPALPSHLDPTTLERGRWGTWLMLPGYLGFLWPGYPHSPGVTLRLPESPWAPQVIGGVAVHLLVLAALAALVLRRSRAALPVGMFALTLLPPIVVMVTQAYMLFAERFMYLPSAGIAWALALGLGAIRARGRRVALVGAAGLVAWSAVATLAIERDWHDDASLFHSMTVRQPRNAVGHVQWARILLERGEERAAREQLDLAQELEPRRPEIPSVRALIHYRHGEWRQVLAESDRSLALDSLRLEPRLTRATALLRLGRLAEAHRALSRLRRELPDEPTVLGLWGQLRLLEGGTVEAARDLDRASRWVKDDADLEFARGVAHARLDQREAARDAFERAVAIDSTFYDGWLHLSVACELTGDRAERDRALARAAALPEARDGRVADLRRRFGAREP